MLRLKKNLTVFLSSILLLSALPLSACGEEEEHVHNWGAWETVTEATCVTSGEKKRVCKDDPSHVETATIPVDATAHEWMDGDVIKQGSCTELGQQAFVCMLDPTHTTVKETYIHDWEDWELVSAATCTEKGEKHRDCKQCDAEETAKFSAIGHDYTNGVCKTCNKTAVLPAEKKDPAFLNPETATSIKGKGEPFDRYQMKEGYFEVEIGNSGYVFMSFSVSSAGQYALYTLNTPNVSLKQHDASAHYIPTDEEGNYLGNEATKLDNGNLLSTVSCARKYYNNEWRATFSFTGEVGTRIRFRFARIADPAWEPSNVYQKVYAKELKEKATVPQGTILKDVDFSTSYFYDESVGYYRMGTKEMPSEIIYAAITAQAPRLFEGCTFATFAEVSNSYALHCGKTVEGNFLLKDYSWFISNYGGVGTFEGDNVFVPENPDPNAVCYENYVNKDGLHPVTQELYEFLVNYTKLNRPVSMLEASASSLENAWLSACFYYSSAVPGTEDNPIVIMEETTSITTKLRSYIYYCLTAPTDGDVTYVLTSTSDNASVGIGTDVFKGKELTTITVKAGQTVVLRVGTANGNKETFDLICTVS
ncbi:MAG: hypothetical protein IJF44_04180 [Clostridia bacterium]|nr:hypothetical protein [Clostridia bacterium]